MDKAQKAHILALELAHREGFDDKIDARHFGNLLCDAGRILDKIEPTALDTATEGAILSDEEIAKYNKIRLVSLADNKTMIVDNWNIDGLLKAQAAPLLVRIAKLEAKIKELEK